MCDDPAKLPYCITVNQENDIEYVKNGEGVYTAHGHDHQWNNCTPAEAAKWMVCKHFNEQDLVDIPVTHAASFSHPEPLGIVSSMSKSLYALAYYGISLDSNSNTNNESDNDDDGDESDSDDDDESDDYDDNYKDLVPLEISLRVKEGKSSSWALNCPLLNLTLNKITTDHPTLTDTFLLEIMRMYLSNQLGPPIPVPDLTDALRLLHNYSRLSWNGRGLEVHYGEHPVLAIAEHVSSGLTELFKGQLVPWNGYQCEVKFKAVPQMKFKKKIHGLTFRSIPDITIITRLYCREQNRYITVPIMTIEAKSPGCAISEGAKSILDAAPQRNERQQREEVVYNELTEALEPYPSIDHMKRTYSESMENAEINFALTLRQAVSQAVLAETNMFAAVDGISLNIFEITHTGAIENDIINMVCNVHHSDVDQKNPGVLLFRALLNKFCYTYGGDSVRNSFTTFTEHGRRFSDTEYSHLNRIDFQNDIQRRQKRLKRQYIAYIKGVVERNVESARSIHNAVEESWGSFILEEPIQVFDKIGHVGEEGVRAKVYKCKRPMTKSSTRVLKLLEPTVDGLKQFENEVNAYVRLQSSEAVASFIPKVYSYGVLNNDEDTTKPVWMLFIELELVEGATVTLDSHRDEINEAERLFSDWGVKHNDIHTRNMFYDTANNQLKIFDFGQATVHPSV